MIRIKNSPLARFHPFASTAIAALLALNFIVPHSGASSPWVEVHPPDIEGAVNGRHRMG